MASVLTCVSAQGRQESRPIDAWLDADALDATAEAAYRWIKSLRQVRMDGTSMRERFTYHGASLWWFTELYLHKTGRLEAALRTLSALQAATAECGPAGMSIDSTNPAEREAARAFAARHQLPIVLRPAELPPAGHGWSSYAIGLTAELSRLRPGRSARPVPATVAAFVHTAFWRPSVAAGGSGEESYIGPVLDAVAERIGRAALSYIGVGPRRNFRARRWWDPMLGRPTAGAPVIPVEQLAPRSALADSRALWRRRHDLARAIVSGDDIRTVAVIDGYDLWGVLAPELEAVARLQWPWSARAMDEAGAALDALAPKVAVTYAEAGGWGRALVVEARRRGIATAGVQHGFIYRHWLNYRHEPDELAPAGSDPGFPYPDRTLLFDGYAARYLTEAGHLPAGSLAVTGSPKLDVLVARYRDLRTGDRAARRGTPGPDAKAGVLVLAAKFREIGPFLGELFDAVDAHGGTRLIVKPHPAEVADPYRELAAGRPSIAVEAPDADLAALLAEADGLVTRNSTVAIDALVLGVPSLVIGLPSNLSPFVEAGVMAGARPGQVTAALEAVLYDREARQRLLQRAERFTADERMRADGQAAGRAADAILALAEPPRAGTTGTQETPG